MTPAVMLRISTVTPGAPRGPWLKNCAKTILAQTTPSWTSMGTFLKSPPADGTASQTKDAAFELPGPCTLSPLGKILFVQVSYRPNKFYKSYGLKGVAFTAAQYSEREKEGSAQGNTNNNVTFGIHPELSPLIRPIISFTEETARPNLMTFAEANPGYPEQMRQFLSPADCPPESPA
ncbi:hypothetical protein RJZ57_008062 [Blastomyces gilchristii]